MNLLYRALHRVVDVVLFVILAAMVAIVSVQIFTRFVLFYSLPWSEELSRYLFAYLILLGACVGVREKNQICIDIIDNFVRGRALKPLELFRYIVQLVTVSILLYSSLQLLKVGARQLSPAMGVPMSGIYLCFPIGFGLVLLELLVKTCAVLAGNKKGSAKREGDEL